VKDPGLSHIPFLNFYHIMSMMQVSSSRKSQNVWTSDSATLAVVCAKDSKRRNGNERTTDKEKLAPAYFKNITGKTLGATQVWKSSWLEGPTVTGADSVFCKQS